MSFVLINKIIINSDKILDIEFDEIELNTLRIEYTNNKIRYINFKDKDTSKLLTKLKQALNNTPQTKKQKSVNYAEKDDLLEFKENPDFEGIDIDGEFRRCKSWYLEKKGQDKVTTRKFVRWLWNAEKTLKGNQSSDEFNKHWEKS